jgi:hypothetical protein
MPTERQTFKVITLDVWGHGPDECAEYDCDGECDGYTVNNAFHAGQIEVDAEEHVYNPGTPNEFRDCFADDATMIKALVDGGYLTPNCTAESIEIEGENDYTLYVNRESDNKPLLQLERVKA